MSLTEKITEDIIANERGVIPGEQIVSVISAMPGGLAEDILLEIASNSRNLTNIRIFQDWEGGICSGVVMLTNKERRSVTLKIGVKEGLFLDDSHYHSFSLKHFKKENGVYFIPVPKEGHLDIVSVANNIVGSWIIHGRNWYDRAGNRMFWAYGIDESRKKKYFFSIESGEGTLLFDALKKGVIRAAHVGTWNNPTTLVPIACGIPTLLHEFEEKASGNNDITTIGGHVISDDGDIWGPYARWSSSEYSEFLSSIYASPFTAHVHNTIKIFSNCSLFSHFLLSKLGDNTTYLVLKILQEKLPQRYYRIIDKDGVTHRLIKVEDKYLLYDNGMKFAKKDLAINMLHTFKELKRVGNDRLFSLKRKKRVVLDTHFYIVMCAILTAHNNISYQVSGSKMFKYLFESDQAIMHRERNESTFSVLKKEFGMDKLKLVVYPSNSLRLPGINQYNFSSEKWNREYWLNKKLTR